ncbi:uncharacterized protein LOC118225159 isoform X2 [Anguilla anguilla]|uniref:uncharacterized protein LOC118225159 isoform X2 n=1 Tax=Anguilla anguilla TaxID=7936 RepID=UPI0015B04A51|nr:uncharacterized protein LOC118225159 isoform X2 [Anguilla anguilla]
MHKTEKGTEMLLKFIIIYFIRTTFCELLSCEHYLRRRVAGVFHYDRNSRYSLTYMEARLACERDFGASIADRKQLLAANEGGMEECRASWISEAEVAYPRVHLNWNCGQNQTGIISYGVRKDLLEKWDVFCYKMDNNCAVHQRAESPGLPSLEAGGNGPFGNVGDLFFGARPTEHGKTTQVFQGGQSMGPTEHSAPVATSISGKQDYMTYPSGHEIESSSLSNELTGRNGGPSNIKNYPDRESDSNIDGQMLGIPLSVVLQLDTAKDEYKTSSGTNNKLGSTISLIKSPESPVIFPSTSVSGGSPGSFEILDPPLVSTFLLSGTSSKTNSDIQSNTVTAYQLSNSFEVIPVPTTQTFTEVLDVIHTSAVGIVEALPEERLDENHEPTSRITAASFHLSSIPSGHIVDELNSESQDSESMENADESKSTGKSTRGNTNGTREFHSTISASSINSPESIITGRNVETASVDRNSTPSITMLTAYENAHNFSASPVNKSKESVPFVSQLEGQRYEHQQMTVDELSTDIQRVFNEVGSTYKVNASITHVQKGLSLVHATAVPTFLNLSIDNEQISDYSETPEGLDYKTGNFSTGPTASLNHPCGEGKVTRNGSCVTVIQLLEEHMQSKEASPYSTQNSTPNVTDIPLQLDKTQEATSIHHYATITNEDLISSTVSPVQDHGTHSPTPTLPMTEPYSKGTMHTAENTGTDWLLDRFIVENSGNVPQTTTKQHNDSLMTTNVVMVTTGTSPQLNLTPGIQETSEATTTMNCGGFLDEEYGDFQSPGFPHAYPSEMDCTWVIFVQQGHLVQLNFLSMVLEEQRGCQYDHIIVFDGRISEKQEIGRFCGSELPPPLRSSSNILTVQMKSDSSVELDGFSAHFQTVKSPAGSGHLQLSGGRNQFGGRVVVDIEGVQGGVCAKHWGNNEATVACRQLGFMGNAVAARMPESMDDLPVSVSLVKCRGDERSLDQCEIKRGGVCSTADRAAVHCQVAQSCSVLRDIGVLVSGTYIIDPDGPGQEQNPFPVYCDMDSQPGAGVTVVSHNSESRTRVRPCEEAGCYSREVVYQNASLPQLRALIEASLSCTQDVKVECRHIRFLGAQWGWWTSWDGRRVDSWGGATTGSRRCACGERGECDLGLSTCNCDANDEVWRSDEGFLSDMTLLPLREVRFGDTRDVPMEMAFHTIGPLQCRGHMWYVSESRVQRTSSGVMCCSERGWHYPVRTIPH